ncbi:MAG TPA: peptidoglycan DD-metalloendopeptidase family protein [Gemmatimonadales bacterium]|nr:peptidoglycan DD-metalloendopeptidase family protein [Gemmatimonadales bacterium]
MRRLRIAAAIGVLVTAAGLALTNRWPWHRLTVAAPIVVRTAFQESRDTLRHGETLGDLFGRHGLSGAEVVAMFERIGLDPRRLPAGLEVLFRHEVGDANPNAISLRTSPVERLAARRSADTWTAERHPVAWRTELVRIEGPIESSLYEALDALIPDALLDGGNRIKLDWDLADVYAWSVDFTRDIQPGDSFAVLLQREISEEGEVRSGGILAADLLASGKHLKAFRFEPVDHVVRFFDGAGNSLRRAFLRAPVEFRRISSAFSRSRFHPILGIFRRHEGTDYAAQSGTPVLAAGDGTVLRAGRAGGYGNLIELRHRNGITTRYGHLRGFARGIHAGGRVQQGDVIGYVGATGLASAPHLHYEFRINGAARDSRRVDLGEGEPLDRKLLPRFLEERGRLERILGTAGQGSGIFRAE